MIPAIAGHALEVRDLCRRFHVRRLELFGSALLAEFDPERSDFDFLVEFGPVPAGAYASNYFGLAEALEKLLGRPVDLVIGSAIRNPYFRQSVDRNKALLYAA